MENKQPTISIEEVLKNMGEDERGLPETHAGARQDQSGIRLRAGPKQEVRHGAAAYSRSSTSTSS